MGTGHNRDVLYVGAVWPGSTCDARRRALAAVGCRVETFDTTAYMRGGPWVVRKISHGLSAGPLVRRLNHDLVQWAADFRGRGGIVWIDKGIWVRRETLSSMREGVGARIVHYTPDPQIVFQRHKQHVFHGAIPEYDVLFTTKPFELPGYRALGGRNIVLVPQSYDDTTLFPRTLTVAEHARWHAEVSFIGGYAPHKAHLLQAAAGTGQRLRLWGPNWRRQLWRYPALRHAYSGDGVWGQEYAHALSAADIALCLLSGGLGFPETTTTRTYEIPASGTFMLAERTDDHLGLYREGVEAEFFGDGQELADKILFYMDRPDLRRRIAAAGYSRCLSGAYGNRARMQRLLERIIGFSAETLEKEAV